jgi:hypothetical protein
VEEEERSSNGVIGARLGETNHALYREGGGGNKWGDGMFQIMVELVAVMVEAGVHWLGPFIDSQGQWR